MSSSSIVRKVRQISRPRVSYDSHIIVEFMIYFIRQSVLIADEYARIHIGTHIFVRVIV